MPLEKRLKDVLEDEVDEKYFLSDKMLDYLTSRKDNFNNGKINYKDENSVASTITKSSSSIDISDNIIKLGNVNPSGNGMNGSVFSEDGVCPSLTTNKGEGVKIGTWRTHDDGRGFREMENNLCPTIPARAREDGSGQPVVKIGAIRGRNPENPKSRQSGLETEQTLEINENGTSNALTTVQKDNVVVISANTKKGFDEAEEEEDSINFSVPSSKTRRGRVGKGVSQTLDTQCNQGIYTQQRIRRLTPTECMFLMDFNPDFIEKTIKSKIVSERQLYKQCGNSIVVAVLAAIINKLKL